VLDDPRRDRVRVEVDGETFTVGVDGVPVVTEVAAGAREDAPERRGDAPGTGAGSIGAGVGSIGTGAGAVAAPLPGVIKSIAVRPGQVVAADDELLVIEAMKMDNVIRATRGGTVGIIHVTEGRQVAYGEPLLEMNSE